MLLRLAIFFSCISFVAALEASSWVNSASLGISDYYLQIPSHSKFTRNITYQALLRNTRPADLGPEELGKEIDYQLNYGPTRQDYERGFYRKMRNLAEPGAEGCGWTLTNYILELITLAKEHPGSLVLANYLNYVKVFGKTKFTECLGHRKMPFNQIYFPPGLVKIFDKFVASYFDLRGKQTDANLYRKAKGLCLTSNDLRLERTQEVAVKYSEREERAGANTLELVSLFIGDMCKYFEDYSISYALQVFNLADAIGATIPTNFPLENLKLVEYSRICVAWKKGDITRPSVMETFADTQDKSKKWYKIF